MRDPNLAGYDRPKPVRGRRWVRQRFPLPVITELLDRLPIVVIPSRLVCEDEKASLLARIDQGWLELWTRVEALDDGALRQPAGNSDWPVSVVLAHYGRWEDWHHEAIRDHLRDGSVRAYTGFDGWNEEWAKEDGALAPNEARDRLAGAHERLRSLLADLRPEQWDETIARWVQGCTFEHYGEHIDSLPA